MSYKNIGIPCVGGKSILYPLMKKILEYAAEKFELDTFIDVCGGGAKLALGIDKTIFNKVIYNELELGMTNLMTCLKDDRSAGKVMYKVNELVEAYDIKGKKLFEEALRLKDEKFTELYLSAAYTVISIYASYGANRMSYCRDAYINNLYFNKIYLNLDRICDSAKDLTINNESFLNMIERVRRNPNILMFIDPPYIQGKNTLKNSYKNKLTIEDHERLVSLLLDKDTKMKWVLCGFDNEIYKALENSDDCIRYSSGSVPQSYGAGAKRNDSNDSENHITMVDEYIWTNYIIPNYIFKKDNSDLTTDEEESNDFDFESEDNE